MSAQAPSRLRWLMIGCAFAATVLNYGYGVLALVGLTLVLFPMGPLTRDETLQ